MNSDDIHFKHSRQKSGSNSIHANQSSLQSECETYNVDHVYDFKGKSFFRFNAFHNGTSQDSIYDVKPDLVIKTHKRKHKKSKISPNPKEQDLLLVQSVFDDNEKGFKGERKISQKQLKVVNPSLYDDEMDSIGQSNKTYNNSRWTEKTGKHRMHCFIL